MVKYADSKYKVGDLLTVNDVKLRKDDRTTASIGLTFEVKRVYNFKYIPNGVDTWWYVFFDHTTGVDSVPEYKVDYAHTYILNKELKELYGVWV